jgi:hypothetical protein
VIEVADPGDTGAPAVSEEAAWTGDSNVLTRIVAALSLSLLAAGCAGETPPLASFTTTAALAVASPPQMLEAVPEAPLRPVRKTMSDRVLTAIALERVTGLKPDPARLTE